MTTIVTKDFEGTYAEPEYGFWSIKKEIALMYWIWPFLQIAKGWFKSFYYIDLFAGSGLMKADNVFFVGSPIVAIGSTLPDLGFDQIICLETDKVRKNILEKRAKMASKHFNTAIPQIFQNDCNCGLKDLLKKYCPKDKACFLAFVDPQKITDLKWTTLQTLLKHGKGDLIINFPTSQIVRNLKNPDSIKALNQFFGDHTWQDVDPTADSILEYFQKKIRVYRHHVNSILVKNETKQRLYDLVFATNSKGMINALKDLKKRLDDIRTKDIRGLYEVVIGDQKQLTFYPTK